MPNLMQQYPMRSPPFHTPQKDRSADYRNPALHVGEGILSALRICLPLQPDPLHFIARDEHSPSRREWHSRNLNCGRLDYGTSLVRCPYVYCCCRMRAQRQYKYNEASLEG